MENNKRKVTKTVNNGGKTKTVTRGTTTRVKYKSGDGIKAKSTTKSGVTTRSKVKIDGKTTEKYRGNKSGTRGIGVSKPSSGAKFVEKTRSGTTTRRQVRPDKKR